MPVHSKMSGSALTRRKMGLVAGAAGLATFATPSVPSFTTARGVQSVPQSASQATVNAANGVPTAAAAPARGGISAPTIAAAAAVAGAAVAGRQRRKTSSSSATKTVCAAGRASEGDLKGLAAQLLAGPGAVDDDFVLRIQEHAAARLRDGGLDAGAAQAFAEVCSTASHAMRSSVQDRLRWAATSMASMLLASVVNLQPASALDSVTYSEFLQQVEKGDVEMVRVENDMMSAQYTSKDGSRRAVNLVPNSMVEDALFNQLAEKKVDVVMQNANAQNGGPFDFLKNFAGPVAWLIAGLLLLFGGVGGPAGPGGQNPFQMGKSKARVIKDGDTKVKFGDVAGCDGAKAELVEVVDFLKNTSRYSDLGAKIPKGALLVGPPGTGKTLLAKAVAGEAGVPFFSISASEFVEVFAGTGAARVRDLFAEAKKAAPCIIFIDEIDAVGRQRSAGFGQGNDEREQTVNQLLTEMDGFEGNKGVVVIAATNRADILDKALVRPGRFDRQIQVDPPDVEGRVAILKVHAKDKTMSPSVDFTAVARQTPGMAGADLANLLNEAAIVAARSNKTEVDSDDISNALERIVIGLEKKDGVMSEKKKKLVAYHEAGHAILGAMMNDFDIVAKISIVPRGPAGGVTIFMPSEERLNTGLYSKEFLENRMCVALGGRIAEELLNGRDNVTTGASNDFQQCTQVASAMVTQLGMSDVVGQRVIGGQGGGGGPFMGRDFMGGGSPPVSQKLKEAVDTEVKRIVDEQYARGMFLLKSNMYLLDSLSAMLMDQEKVGGEELMKLINKVAMEGKLVDENTRVLAAAAYTGERAPASASKTAAQVFGSVAPRHGHRASFAGLRHGAAGKRSAIARLGLAEHGAEAVPATTGEKVTERVRAMATEASSAAVPEDAVRMVSARVLAALAATAMPFAAFAEDVPPAAPPAPRPCRCSSRQMPPLQQR